MLVRLASRSLLGSILGHQVAPQNYGGLTIALDHVLGGQKLLYVDLGREKVVV